MRRSHTVNGVTTTYTYDLGAGLPVALQDGTNTLVYGLDLISTTDAGGVQRYFSYDGLGSVTDLTDGTGAVTDTYSYDVFGAVRARTGTNASPWKYTGEQEDGAAGDTGYYFLRARYMDSATGRFVSQDPLGFDQRYAYAENNPSNRIDPSGMASEVAPNSEGDGGSRLPCSRLEPLRSLRDQCKVKLGTQPTASPSNDQRPLEFLQQWGECGANILFYVYASGRLSQAYERGNVREIQLAYLESTAWLEGIATSCAAG